jgi:SAM-dependent methyltransferase
MGPPPLSLHAWLRYAAVQRLLARAGGARTLLEIGAGMGSAGFMLARRYEYVGLELDAASYAIAARRFERGGVRRMVHGDLSALRASTRFDVVCAFEVLEHYEDDVDELRRWRERVRPGGWMLISVPAGSHRFAAADERAGHYRRYDRDDLRGLFATAGFDEPAIVTYGCPVGYVLEAARNHIARRQNGHSGLSASARTAASARWLQPGEALAPAMALTAAPFRLLQRPFGGSPFGTGHVALARAA